LGYKSSLSQQQQGRHQQQQTPEKHAKLLVADAMKNKRIGECKYQYRHAHVQ